MFKPTSAERWVLLTGALACALATAGLGSGRAQADDQWPDAPGLPAESLQPGLVAEYRSRLEPNAAVTQIDPKPAILLEGSTPHPRIAPGPIDIVWRGRLLWREPAPVTFSAYVYGQLEVYIDGKLVLQGHGRSMKDQIGPGGAVEGAPGVRSIEVRYQSPKAGQARLQIWWQSDRFSPQPLPPWLLLHDPAERPDRLERDQRVAQGRAAITEYGCAQCHRGDLPSISEPPPGPALHQLSQRVNRSWLLKWLEDPPSERPGSRMPLLFDSDRRGDVQRHLVADYLLGQHDDPSRNGAELEQTNGQELVEADVEGDYRLGRRHFISLGCHACHFLPDQDPDEQVQAGQRELLGLGRRWNEPSLAAFLQQPHSRYPDGRMPDFNLDSQTAADMAAYLLLWSSAESPEAEHADDRPADEDFEQVFRELGVSDAESAGRVLIEKKGCAACHSGLEQQAPDIPLSELAGRRGCLTLDGAVRFAIDEPELRAIEAYLEVACQETHASPFFQRQRLIEHLGCLQCHRRDSDRAAPIERIGSTLGSAWLQRVPYQRTPSLTYPLQKYRREYLVEAIRDGVHGVRDPQYTYRMPTFEEHVEQLVRALAEADGDLPGGYDCEAAEPGGDPTAGPLFGPRLVGAQGFSCIACHVWDGRRLSDPDPGAIGPDLLTTAERIRRPWFDRFLEEPLRYHPGTPMPAAFQHGQPSLLTDVLDGDPARQKDALWNYFALGSDAPDPQPPPPITVPAPEDGQPPLVAQIPIHVDGRAVEAICLVNSDHDLLLYDLAAGQIHRLWPGARLFRSVEGRVRRFQITSSQPPILAAEQGDGSPLILEAADGTREQPEASSWSGYQRSDRGVLLQRQVHFNGVEVHIDEQMHITREAGQGVLHRRLHFQNVPPGGRLLWKVTLPEGDEPEVDGLQGTVERRRDESGLRLLIQPDAQGQADVVLAYHLPPAAEPPPVERPMMVDAARPSGPLERPGYRAVEFPLPRSTENEDLVMPSAVAVQPNTGRVFVASMKRGELFELQSPLGDPDSARLHDYARGLFQDAYSMLADDEGLLVLHRRSLTRVIDRTGDGTADTFQRVLALPHGVADTYDYAYGLVRDPAGHFVFSYAPYANRHMPGSGGAVRADPAGSKIEPIGYGMRNPLGWTTGPGGEVFFTDNEGEWVATNKLEHLQKGRFYGFPNPEQSEHTERPHRPPALWIPYDWAQSINGVTYDNTEGKFGPFAGQFFLAELMFGGAIIRASLEKVEGQYQGVCFPWWGAGLLGPLTLDFHDDGHMFVGSITEPGWMAQPDRGGLFRIDFTGEIPFEIQTIRVRPQGFELVFTQPVERHTAEDPASYDLEHYRYEYTGAYGSPELDRTAVAVHGVRVSADGRRVQLQTDPLVTQRVYRITAAGVRSVDDENLVHPTGAYTLNAIPQQ